MGDVGFGVFLGLAFAAVMVMFGSATYSAGKDTVRNSVLNECKSFGAFSYGDTIYECKVRP